MDSSTTEQCKNLEDAVGGPQVRRRFNARKIGTIHVSAVVLYKFLLPLEIGRLDRIKGVREVLRPADRQNGRKQAWSLSKHRG